METPLLNLFVKVIAPSNLGVPTAKAYVSGEFPFRKDAEDSDIEGHIMTKAMSVKFIERWNKNFPE